MNESGEYFDRESKEVGRLVGEYRRLHIAMGALHLGLDQLVGAQRRQWSVDEHVERGTVEWSKGVGPAVPEDDVLEADVVVTDDRATRGIGHLGAPSPVRRIEGL